MATMVTAYEPTAKLLINFSVRTVMNMKSILWQITKTLPNTILSNWLKTRQRDFEMHKKALELAQVGIIIIYV